MSLPFKTLDAYWAELKAYYASRPPLKLDPPPPPRSSEREGETVDLLITLLPDPNPGPVKLVILKSRKPTPEK